MLQLQAVYGFFCESPDERIATVEKGLLISIHADEITIGRRGQLLTPSCFSYISKEHCKLVHHALSGWSIEDLCSSYGTWLKRGYSAPRRLTAHRPEKLEREDIIIMGSLDSQGRIEFRIL